LHLLYWRSLSAQANSSPEGKQTLNEFVGKKGRRRILLHIQIRFNYIKDVPLRISGFAESTGVASLVEAFKTLQIDVNLPSLQTDLLDTAALTGLFLFLYFSKI
jgi:hypothetical protein